MKKKTFLAKEVKFAFKQLDNLFSQEIEHHTNMVSHLMPEGMSQKEAYAFIEGIKYARKYIAKQYYDVVLKDMEDDEFIANSNHIIRV